MTRLDSGLTKDVRTLQTALDEAEGSGDTALVDGSYSAILLGESDVGRALLIVFSDGVDTSSWLSADAVLDIARRSTPSSMVCHPAPGGTRRSCAI